MACWVPCFFFSLSDIPEVFQYEYTVEKKKERKKAILCIICQTEMATEQHPKAAKKTLDKIETLYADMGEPNSSFA